MTVLGSGVVAPWSVACVLAGALGGLTVYLFWIAARLGAVRCGVRAHLPRVPWWAIVAGAVVGAGVFVALPLREALCVTFVVAALFVCAETDARVRLVFHEVLWPALAIGAANAVAINGVSALGAIAIATAFMWFFRLTTKGGIGAGDVRVAALIGTLLAPVALGAAASAAFIVAGIMRMFLHRTPAIDGQVTTPYGSYLVGCAVAVVLLGTGLHAPGLVQAGYLR